MSCLSYYWFFTLLMIKLNSPVNGIIVTLPDGKIEGITEITTANTTFHSFLAVRYAKPPVGDLRFQLPQPLDPWNDVYNATTEKTICFQTNMDSPKEDEDCLFINVFTPKNLTSGKVEADLPVMAFIHGGGFLSGSAYKIEGGNGPNFLMDYGVIMVAFQYRLGPFGFGSTSDLILPGNLGLKDQVFALKWIQNNIQYFGGNPEKVTIFGQSAGAASVSYHLVSPLSKGLFAGAIQESGSALDPWAFRRDQNMLTYWTLALAYPDLPVFSMNSTRFLELLKNASAKDIDEASYTVYMRYETSPRTFQIQQGFVYAPVIEPDHETAFLNESQYHLFESGKVNNVPVMVGMNSEESLILLSYNYTDAIFKAYDREPIYLVPDDMNIGDFSVQTKVGREIYDYHVGSGNFSYNAANAIKFHSMHDFDKGAIKQAELQSNNSSSIWFYELTYDGLMGNNILNRNPHIEGMGNVTHGEELNYIFSRWYSEEIPDNTDSKYFPEGDWIVHKRMMTLWTNFAKYQNPTPQNESLLQNITWTNVNPDNFVYLEIGRYLEVKTGYPKSEMYKFWNEMFSEYANSPLITF